MNLDSNEQEETDQIESQEEETEVNDESNLLPPDEPADIEEEIIILDPIQALPLNEDLEKEIRNSHMLPEELINRELRLDELFDEGSI